MAHRLRLKRRREESPVSLSALDDETWLATLKRKYEEGVADGKSLKEIELQERMELLQSILDDTRRDRDSFRARAINGEALAEAREEELIQVAARNAVLEVELKRLKHQGPLSMLQNRVNHGKQRSKSKGTKTPRGGERRAVSGRVRRG